MILRYIMMVLCSSALLARDEIGPDLYTEELVEFLRTNYKTSTTLGYTNARDTLYLRIDRIDGQVKGVYTNYSVSLADNGIDPSTHLYENGLNCEHIWPQSLFEGGEPTKSDMHSLRPCKDDVNSARGNKPFNEINDSLTITWYWMNNQTADIPSFNINEYSENYSSYFEPREDRKGDIARTIFYFYTMYYEIAEVDFFEGQKAILKTWHEQDPADSAEIERTWNIAEYQENKPNPFILDATLIWRAYFYDGLILGDVNGDGNLNVLDILDLVNIVLGNTESTPAGDMNGDEQFNIQDIVILVEIILS